jgi:cell division protein FtsI (penicillin-binding protein 3)
MIDSRGTRRRLALTVVAVFAIVGCFFVRLVDLQVVRAADLTASAEERRQISVITYGIRGSIVDTNGVVLADSVDRFDITASPRNMKLDVTKMTVDGERVEVPTTDAIARIAEITGVPAQELFDALVADPTSDFTYLARKVDLATFTAVVDLDIVWVYSEPHPARSYPNGAIAGNLIGFIGTDGPLAGTELKQDACLAGTNGVSTYERGADGVRLPGSTLVQEAPVDGGQIRLTINADLQWYVQQMVAEQATAIGADWANAIVVEVSTGRIVANADWPTIDPNDLSSVSAQNSGARSFTGPFEPGSIIKPATFASLLDAGVITPLTQVIAPGRYTTGLPEDDYIRDAWAHDDLRYTAAGVLMNSSNTGTAVLSERLDVQTRSDYLSAFGFGTPTAVDFLGEADNAGRLIPVAELDAVSAVTQQFGQGMTATSAQIANMYQTLGNGGVRMPLTLVEGCEWPDGTVTHTPGGEGVRVVSEYAADTTVQMMEAVASQGHLRSILTIPGYRVAAKTGTAEVAENGRYGDQRIVSVAGLVPAEAPQYAVVVTFAKPDTMKTSAAAAPTFNAIMEQVIKTFRITPSTEPAPNLPLTW